MQVRDGTWMGNVDRVADDSAERFGDLSAIVRRLEESQRGSGRIVRLEFFPIRLIGRNPATIAAVREMSCW